MKNKKRKAAKDAANREEINYWVLYLPSNLISLVAIIISVVQLLK